MLAAGLLVLALAATTFAAEAAMVTVRVEGLTETKLPPTQVTLSGAPVVKDGVPADACEITSGVGALQLATGGHWEGPWNSKYNQYEIFSIEGETHEFEPSSTANYYWSFWLNDKESEVGACEAQLNSGDRVLFFPSCYGAQCPFPAPLPLEAEAPTSANVGEPVQVVVRKFNTAGVGSEVAGATVVGGGAGAVTEAHGRAVITFSHAGETMLQVNAPNAIRTETTVCVHDGNDGTCGTTVPPAVPSPTPVVVVSPSIPPDVALLGGVTAGHIYAARHAPRVLTGTIEVPSGGTLRDVRIRLERSDGRRCFGFDGAREEFVHVHCGRAEFFSVGDTESFSYLLPTPLKAGRYVYDIEALNDSGASTKLVWGVSQAVFRVR
ncbi:MAG TPA: DUF4430 domain-containing protein [Solirubrobacteraceae bacterium]|nr:DUF4430 domain-containing protein [Solirubrobacteraceae bacterium]